MKSAPPHVKAELQRYDPDLRLRWSREKNCFILERKSPRIFLAKPIVHIWYSKSTGKTGVTLCPENSDRRIAYKDGFVPILKVHKLDRRLFWMIYQMDSRRVPDVNKEIEDKENAHEKNVTAKGLNEVYDMSGDAYDKLKFIRDHGSEKNGVLIPPSGIHGN